jgi:hypothetical protein
MYAKDPRPLVPASGHALEDHLPLDQVEPASRSQDEEVRIGDGQDLTDLALEIVRDGIAAIIDDDTSTRSGR